MAHRPREFVCAAVGIVGAMVGHVLRRVERAERLDNVVLDEWVGHPAVDGQVAVASGVELGVKFDGPCLAGAPSSLYCVSGCWCGFWRGDEYVPALATDEVAAILPVDVVATAIFVLVVNVAAAVGPEVVVKAAVLAF